MEIKLAKYAGACYGVQRALEAAHEVIAQGIPSATLGPLIHNPVVVDDLKAHGMKAIAAPDDINVEEIKTVVIRSHGVTPEVLSQLEGLKLDIVDATCPHVARAQKGAAELAANGCHVLVVGEAGHPEVESLVAYAKQGGARVDVVLIPEDIPDDLDGKVGIVVQTTQRRENLDAIVEALELQGVVPEVKDTICAATQKRQAAAAELARQVDAMVVIGGRNSSNTTRLAEICAQSCPNTFHIETVDELDAIDLTALTHSAANTQDGDNATADVRSKGNVIRSAQGADATAPLSQGVNAADPSCRDADTVAPLMQGRDNPIHPVIGITAGASTPPDQIEAVVEKIKSMT